jgi:hypothetical protein
MELTCTSTSRSRRSTDRSHAPFCLQQQWLARKMPPVSYRYCGGTMQDFGQSGVLYFDLPSNPAKRNPERLLSDINDMVAYAI